MKLFDTHAHLDSPKIFERLDEVLSNANEAGVERIVAIGASRGFESNRQALAIARQYDWIRCTIGLHPHEAESADEAAIALLRDEFAGDPQVVGIGETGLDYFYDNAPVEQQKWAFRQFLQMSKDFKKPVIIHSRDADQDCIEMLKETGVTGGILHCFTGSRWMAEELFKLDFYLSFSGIVTFKSAAQILDIARDTPIDRILLETDSPYLAPIPHRGRPNEPAYVRHTAEKIAEARGMAPDALAQAAWENAARVFNWPSDS